MMNNKKSRSSLKKVSALTEEVADPARCIKRRISFSEKKFIREFDAAEKPKDYDHSYEISDHTNGSDSSGQSHATVAASLLQSTARISVANYDMDKENTLPDASALVYDQQSRNDFTFKLQTSINVTLLPDEMSRNLRRIESPSLEFTSGDSLSLYDMERDKLRENSIYNNTVFDKTVDLVPKKLIIAESAYTHLDNKENVSKPTIIFNDITCLSDPKKKDAIQKTVVFENHDITCDFMDIDPREAATTKPTQENVSLDMAERDYVNYFADDSTEYSPLIPSDVISENGIGKKLNLRELNDALNSGRIQLFPNGPRRPPTDRTPMRYKHGFEEQPMEQEEENVPLKEIIRPRGTLNFNDSMMLSPAPQIPESKLTTKTDQSIELAKSKNLKDPKCNYRFSQADELMLDNTNFLVHAKMGDETHSRNSSKCSSSRRETTYDNTAMELDDLEKREAAVAAALETAKNKKSMNYIEAMEEDAISMPCKKATDTQHNNIIKENDVKNPQAQQQSKPRQTLHNMGSIEDVSFSEPVTSQRQTLHVVEPIDEVSFVPKSTSVQRGAQYKKHRPTLHMAEPIKLDIIEPKTSQQTDFRHRRDTLHTAENIDEDIVEPRQEMRQASTVINQQSKRRQTLLLVESMEEDSFCAHDKILTNAPTTKTHDNKHRHTMHVAENIEEEKPQQNINPVKEQQSTRRRQTLLLADPIEEDTSCAHQHSQVESHHIKQTQTINITNVIEEDVFTTEQYLKPHATKANTKRRQTLRMVESIEEDTVTAQQTAPSVKQPHNKSRQTLHLVDPINEDSFCAQDANQQRQQWQQLQSKTAAPAVEVSQTRRRQTMHLADPIEEDSFCAQEDYKQASANEQRQMLDEIIPEDIPQPAAPTVEVAKTRQRQTLHLADPIEEDSFCAQQGLNQHLQNQLQSKPAAPTREVSQSRRRQTMHLADPIEEDSFCAQKDYKQASANQQRQMLDKIILEDIPQPRQHLQLKPAAPTVEVAKTRQRQTMHLADPIEEDSFCAEHDLAPHLQNRLQSKHAAPSVDMSHSRQHQTWNLGDPIEEDSFCASAKDILTSQMKVNSQSVAASVEMDQPRRRQTLHLADPIEEDSICVQKEEKSMPNAKSRQLKENYLKPQHDFHLKSKLPIPEKQYNRRRQTVHLADPIEEDSFCVQSEENQRHPVAKDIPTCSIIKQSDDRRRQTMHLADPMEKDSFCKQNDLSATATKEENSQQRENNNNSKSIHQLKPRQTIHLAEPMEEEICSATKALRLESAPVDQCALRARRTLSMEKAFEEEVHCMPRKPNDKEENVVESKLRIDKIKKDLRLSESMEIEPLSQSLNDDHAKASGESPSDSAEWLAQMRQKARQTIAKSMKLEDNEKASPVLQTKYNRSALETPKPNKKQLLLRQSYFAITPGRSMIEYEDLEQECKSDSSASSSAVAQAVDMDLDIDRSNYGTPLAAFKPATLSNVKRLPTHLTPNYPQSKKRYTQSIQIEYDNKTILSSPWHEEEQLDGTVQMVRAQMMRQTRSHFETEMNHVMENKQKLNAAGYDDNPITISDVSDHFSAQRELAKRSVEQAQNTNTDSRESNEHNFKNYATAHKEFINLSGDTVLFAAADLPDEETASCEIDKTRLSLVSTLLDEDDADAGVQRADDHSRRSSNSSIEPIEAIGEAEICLEQINPPAIAGAIDACKRCTRCKRSVDKGGNNSVDSFELPDWRELDVRFERLERMRQRSHIEDVHKYWELRKLERFSSCSNETTNVNVQESISVINESNRLNLTQMLQMFNNKWLEYKKNCATPKPVETFVKRLESQLCAQLPNWIFDYQLQCNRNYIFSHRKITTFCIVVNYDPLDVLETEIRVNSINLDTPKIIPKSQWTVYEHLMDFQLRLNLPLNLDNLLDEYNTEAFVRFLQHIDETCIKILDICNSMHLVLSMTQARLLREPNRYVVRKVVRQFIKNEDEAYMRVEKTQFRIEIGNVQEISFKNIVDPPLYQFDENIQFLPSGIAFLEAFMHTPERYLKRHVEQTN